MAIHSRSSVQNFDNWWFWIRKNKHIVQFNKRKDKHDVIIKMYLYARDLNEPKYEYLIKKCKNIGIKHLNDPNALIECSNTMDDVYENIDDYNPSRKRNILIVFDDMMADIKRVTKSFKPEQKNCLLGAEK